MDIFWNHTVFFIFMKLFYVALKQNIVLNFFMHRFNAARFGNEMKMVHFKPGD